MTPFSTALVGRVVLLGLLSAGQGTQPSISALLDAYSRHDFLQAAQTAALLPNLGREWRRRYPAEAGKWIDAVPGQTSERRLVAAALVLETTRERMAMDPEAWGALVPVLGWAIDQLEKGPPTPAELAWHHALIALAQRDRMPSWLTSSHATFCCGGQDYLTFVQKRFPTDTRLAFQKILIQVRDLGVEKDESGRPGTLSTGNRTKAIRILETMKDDPDVGDEAEARIAHLYLTRGDLPSAVAHAAAASRLPGDGQTRYLAEVIQGRAREGLKQPLDARDAYLRALTAMPDGESAALLLAALNSTLLPSSEVTAKVEAALLLAPRDEDPLRLYAFGDYMRWHLYVDAFRKTLP